MNNPMCDGSGPCHPGQVRVLPLGSNPHHGNLILCRSCFGREIRYRRARNFTLAADCAFALPMWEDLRSVREGGGRVKPTTGPVTAKLYRCARCGHEQEDTMETKTKMPAERDALKELLLATQRAAIAIAEERDALRVALGACAARFEAMRNQCDADEWAENYMGEDAAWKQARAALALKGKRA